MPLSDRIDQLEGEIRGRFEEALRELRDSVRQRLREGEEEALRRLDELTERLPRGVLEREDVESIALGAGAEGRQTAWGDLLEGLAAIDGSDGQAETLNALLAEARRYSSRSVLFLTRTAAAEAWGASGWGGIEVAGTRVDWQESEGWRRLAGGRGTVRLSGSDCAVLCSRLESPLPAEGLLVPLVLRDRVAAALYADRLESDGPLGVEALQLLTWAAAQTIESQPFRHRSVTPTLHPADEGEASLPLWDAPAGETERLEGSAEARVLTEIEEAPAAEAEAEAEELELGEPLEELELEPAPEPGAESIEQPSEEAPPAPVEEPPGFEEEEAAAERAAEPEPEQPAVEEPPEAPPERVPAGFAATQDVEPQLPEVEPPAPPEPVWEAEPEAEGELELEEPEPEAAAPAETSQPEEIEAEAFQPDAEPPEPDQPEAYPLEPEPSEGEEPLAAAPSAGEEPEIEEPPSPAEAWGQVPVEEPIEEPEVEEPPIAAEPEAPPEPAPPPPEPESVPAAPDPGATQFIDRSNLGLPGQPPPPPPGEAVHEPGEVTTVGRPRGGAQVTPPEDVVGPGWAFARGPGSSGDDAVHEEARRLARLLVSEIRLYNEEQVEEGRRNQDIYDRLKDDIDRSRQMYEERVDPAALGGTDYFQEELVRILAAGDAEALGMES